MTFTVKDSPELNSPGKPGAPSQNSQNKPGQSPRTNPVCLEVGITIRSLPGESASLTQPIREEGRTVIVFDNGAVLRTTNNLPVGLKVIVSNPKGRDVVCQVVGGRNSAHIKGYVEVQFLEPVNDFWGIHQDVDPLPVAAPPSPLLPPGDAAAQSSSPAPRTGGQSEAHGNSASAALWSDPTFDDLPGLLSVPPATAAREPNAELPRPNPDLAAKAASDYNLSEVANPTSLANWNLPPPGVSSEKHAAPPAKEALPAGSTAPVPTRDFMSKGLMAYEQAKAPASGPKVSLPLIVGAAVLVLAGIGGGAYFLHRGTAVAPSAKMDVASQSSVEKPQVASSAPQPVQTLQEEAAQAATQSQSQAPVVAADQPSPAPAAAPLPDIVIGPSPANERTEPRNSQRPEKKATAPRQAEVAPAHRPAIQNLKIGSPIAPQQSLANPGEGAVPIADVASNASVRATTPAGLLTSAGRTSNPPAPPPPSPAPAAPAHPPAVGPTRDPKLLSSVRLVYPANAKETGIQGSVLISVNIDANGNVVSARAQSGPIFLRQAAVDSVKQWKYSPALQDGKPVPSLINISVDFRLN